MGPVESASLSTPLSSRIVQAVHDNGGWLPFDRFMSMALYEPGLGYYANGSMKFGRFPASGSDFVTAPELSALFGRALAVQIAQALQATGCADVWEFGAGSGALAEQLLRDTGPALQRYHIVDLPGELRQRQQQRLGDRGGRVCWHDRLPQHLEGVIVGNELFDAMPVQLLSWDGRTWHERGVAVVDSRFDWSDRPTDLRPPVAGPFAAGAVVEIHAQAEAFVRTLAQRLGRGAAFFVDYGFPESEYYHVQRHQGTLLCHRAHQVDDEPLEYVGSKDITAHVNFSAIALAGQDAGWQVLGYTSQARFLLNCGLASMMGSAGPRQVAAAGLLINEHEMGELFKVIGFVRGAEFDAIGFTVGDRNHRL
jgi:SAM-dependent MidA family methyltransferase